VTGNLHKDSRLGGHQFLEFGCLAEFANSGSSISFRRSLNPSSKAIRMYWSARVCFQVGVRLAR